MLKSLSLRADGLPVSGLGYDEITAYSTRGEGFHAAGRTAFRESYLNSAIMEMAIESQAMDALNQDPETLKTYRADLENSRRLRFQSGPGSQVGEAKADKYIKRYSPEEFEQIGFTIHEGIEFDDDGKLSLPRFSIYSQAFEDNQADAETVAAMRPGVGSWAAGLAGGLAYSLVDPINLIPFGAGISRAKSAYKAGKGSRWGILGGAMKAGAVEGAMGATVVDAISFPQANRWGADLGWEEALADIGVSGLLGSMFGAFGGGLEMFSHRMGRSSLDALQKAVSDLENGLAPDVEAALKPIINEARARFEEKMADPKYLTELLNKETSYLDGDAEVFGIQLDELEAGRLRESGKFSRAPSGPDGPRMVIGDAPAVLRMIDGFSYLEISPDLIRRIKLEDSWNGFDLRQLPKALARPAAVFDMGQKRKVALIGLFDRNGRSVAALVEIESGFREFYGPKGENGVAPKSPAKSTKTFDAYSEISDINFINAGELSAVGQARRLLRDGRALYADSAKLSEISGLSVELADAAVYARPEVLTPENLRRHLAMEDLGVDLDSLNFGREIDLSGQIGAKVEAGRIEENNLSATAMEGSQSGSDIASAGVDAKAAKAGRNLETMVAKDPQKAMDARALEAELLERRIEEMAARGELSDEDIDLLNNGNRREGDEAIVGREAEAQIIEKGEAMMTATECALDAWGI